MNAKRNYFGYPLSTVCELIQHPVATTLIRMGLYDILKCIGMKVEDIEPFTQTIINEMHNSKDVCECERNLAKLCQEKIVPSILRTALDERAKKIAHQISPHLIGKRILDLGCGDGMVMNFVEGKEYDVKLADVSNYVDHRVSYPFTLLRAPKLKDISCVFETVLLLTVLHHSSDPEDVIAGLNSLKANRIIVIESVLEVPDSTSQLARLLAEQHFEIRLAFAIFADWFYNRVLHKDVLVPYNLGTVADWHKLFGRYGYYLILSQNLGIDQPLVPEVHQLLIYERS